MRLTFLAILFFAAGAAAQASFVVDASAGPGSQFTDIQTAVQAVPSGSVLIVRAGSYSPVLIDGKGLAILCDPGVEIAPPAFFATGPFLSITNTQSNQVVAVSGLGFGPLGLQGHDGILIENAMGLVHIDGQGRSLQPLAPPIAGIGATLRIDNSSQVVVRDLALLGGARVNPGGAPTPQPGCVVDNSAVVFERCQLRGSDSLSTGQTGILGRPALAAANSRVELVETSVAGGNGWSTLNWQYQPVPGPFQFSADAAIAANNSLLVARGAGSHTIAGGTVPAAGATLPAVQIAAIVGTGSLRIDPAIAVSGGVAASMQVTTAPLVRLTSNLPALGGTASATCSAAGGSLVAVGFGSPAPASTLPGIADPLWLAGANSVVVAFGLTSAGGQFPASVAIPGLASLRGITFVWQAAAIGTSGLAALSNPSAAHVR